MFTREKASTVLLTLIVVWSGNSLRADDKPAEVETLKKELAAARKKIAELEKGAESLRTALAEQRSLVIQAQFAEKLARLTAEHQTKIAETFLAKMKEWGADSKGAGHPALPLVNPSKPPALPPTLRGEVNDVAGDLLTISIGMDAGLTVGSVLELYRGDGKTAIGTVKVTDAFNLYSKDAVVRFYPSRKVAIRDLKPNELPKKGDQVRPVKTKE